MTRRTPPRDPGVCRRAALFSAIEGLRVYTAVCPDDARCWECLGRLLAVVSGAEEEDVLPDVRHYAANRREALALVCRDLGQRRGMLVGATHGMAALHAACDPDPVAAEREARHFAAEAHRLTKDTMALREEAMALLT